VTGDDRLSPRRAPCGACSFGHGRTGSPREKELTGQAEVPEEVRGMNAVMAFTSVTSSVSTLSASTS
jgi:uncharacterized protein YegL